MTHTDEGNSLRLFCAVELPTEVRALAAAHAARLRERFTTPLKVGWEREEKLHLTLKFFGDLAPARIESLTRALTRAAASVPVFEARIQDSGVFPNDQRPRSLWLGFADATGNLASLKMTLEDECARENFPHDARAFQPHVTLARIRLVNGETRRLAKLHEEITFETERFKVGEFVLMRSQLGAGGSTYTVHSRYKLGA